MGDRLPDSPDFAVDQAALLAALGRILPRQCAAIRLDYHQWLPPGARQALRRAHQPLGNDQRGQRRPRQREHHGPGQQHSELPHGVGPVYGAIRSR